MLTQGMVTSNDDTGTPQNMRQASTKDSQCVAVLGSFLQACMTNANKTRGAVEQRLRRGTSRRCLSAWPVALATSSMAQVRTTLAHTAELQRSTTCHHTF